MTWLFFALAAPLLYTVVTFVDKYLLESEVSDYNTMPIYIGIVGFIAGLILFVTTGMPVLPLRDALIVLTTGILAIVSFALYFKAMSMEDASHINILFQTFPIITLILSYIFLGERMNAQQMLGFVIILSASIGISIEKDTKFFTLSPAFFIILLHNCIWATSGVLMKFALNVSGFADVLSYESFGIAIGAVLLYLFVPTARKAFHRVTPTLSNRAKLFIFINESLTVLAKATTFYAFSLGPITLVSVFEGFQSFYAILLGWILTLLLPHIFKEDISKEGLFKKIACAGLAIFGVFLIS